MGLCKAKVTTCGAKLLGLRVYFTAIKGLRRKTVGLSHNPTKGLVGIKANDYFMHQKE